MHLSFPRLDLTLILLLIPLSLIPLSITPFPGIVIPTASVLLAATRIRYATVGFILQNDGCVILKGIKVIDCSKGLSLPFFRTGCR